MKEMKGIVHQLVLFYFIYNHSVLIQHARGLKLKDVLIPNLGCSLNDISQLHDLDCCRTILKIEMANLGYIYFLLVHLDFFFVS